MAGDNLFFFKILVAASCFVYGALFLQNSTRDSARFFCGIGEIAIGFWALFDELQNLLTDINSLILIQTCIYLCAQVAVCSLISFTYLIFSQKSQINKDKIYRIFLIPFITLFLIIITEVFTKYHLFLKTPEFLKNEKYPAYNFPKNFFYYFHSALCYTSIASCIIFSFYTEIRHPKSNRSIIISYSLTAIFFLMLNLYRFAIENFYKDMYKNFPQLTSTFSYIIFSSSTFFTIYFHKKERNLRVLNGQLFNSSDFPIISFTNDHEYVSANPKALEFLKNYSIEPTPYQKFNKQLIEKQFIILGVPESFDSDNEFYLSGIFDKQLYYVKRVNLYSIRKKQIGYYIMISEMNMFSGAFSNLERESQSDELTGCKKRKVFEQTYVNEMSNATQPLIVVCARIENLSDLNEKIGLKKTDHYIITFANILKNSLLQASLSPIECKDVFRIDGSLFVFMISIKDQEIIPELFSAIKKECSRFSKNRTEQLSCSLGYSVASNKEYSASKVLQKSFDNMLVSR